MQKILLTLFAICLTACTTKTLTPEAIKYQAAQKVIAEGNNFPAFALPNAQGETITDTKFNDGDVFYMLWGTWCASCIDNIIAVRDMRKKGLWQNVEFVAVSVDEDEKRWKQFIYQYDMDDYMENILLKKDREHELSNFLFAELAHYEYEDSILYAYITPAYSLVKNGKIISNSPTLPKDKATFMAQF